MSLHVAASLDGFIARGDGGIDWLPLPEAGGEDSGLGRFQEEVELIVTVARPIVSGG